MFCLFVFHFFCEHQADFVKECKQVLKEQEFPEHGVSNWNHFP